VPKIKAVREDVLRKPEVDAMLEKAKDLPLGERLQCFIALAWLFGKRVSEILQLKREDIYFDERFLYVRFKVGKKRAKGETPIPRFYVKKISLKHPYVQYVLNWVNKIQEGYIFPGSTGRKVIKVKAKYRDRSGNLVEKEYQYEREGGHLSDARMRQLIKLINPNAWWHLFRESLATQMAEMGASEEELMHWFDWSDPRVAHEYVKRGTKLIEKWAEREW